MIDGRHSESRLAQRHLWLIVCLLESRQAEASGIGSQLSNTLRIWPHPNCHSFLQLPCGAMTQTSFHHSIICQISRVCFCDYSSFTRPSPWSGAQDSFIRLSRTSWKQHWVCSFSRGSRPNTVSTGYAYLFGEFFRPNTGSTGYAYLFWEFQKDPFPATKKRSTMIHNMMTFVQNKIAMAFRLSENHINSP